MKNLFFLFVLIATLMVSAKGNAQQIDFNNLNPRDILSRAIKVEKGFSPQFYIGNVKIPKIDKLGEILGMKNNAEINRLFKTFKTGRTVFQIASYTGAAITVYGAIKKIDADAKGQEADAALISGLSSIATGVVVKLLTKKASYKAVDIFNGVVQRTIKDIFKIGSASQGHGVGLYVSL